MKTSAAAPTAWRNVPLWALFRRVKDVGHPHEQMLSVYRDHGVVTKDDRTDNHNKTAQNRNIYQLIGPGWLVVNRMKAWQGSVGISKFRGIVSGHYLCFAPLHDEDPRFLNHLIRSAPYTAELRRLSRGVRPSQAEIDNDLLHTLPLALPPLAEQRAIADYLDAETARIDALIAKKQQLIHLLEERYTAQVELCFLDVSPAPLKFFVSKIGSGSTPRGGSDVYLPAGAAFLRSQNVQNGHLDLTDVVFIGEPAQQELSRARVRTGDVLLNITGGSIGRTTVFNDEGLSAFVSQHVCIVRPISGVSSKLMSGELKSERVAAQIRLCQVGGNREGLNFEQVADLLVRVPDGPAAHEIEARMDELSRRHETLTAGLATQLSLLKERRQALITTAVTGEFTVPGAA